MFRLLGNYGRLLRKFETKTSSSKLHKIAKKLLSNFCIRYLIKILTSPRYNGGRSFSLDSWLYHFQEAATPLY